MKAYDATTTGAKAPIETAASQIDWEAVWVLRGACHFPDVRARVEKLELALFTDGAERTLAHLIICDPPMWREPWHLSRAEKWKYNAISIAFLGTTIPDTSEWAHSITTKLAQRRCGPLLIDTLRWAADQIEKGQMPGWWVLKKIEELMYLIDNNPEAAAA